MGRVVQLTSHRRLLVTFDKDAEELLKGKPSGTFLVRVAESRFGYSLTLIHEGEIKHFMIDLNDDVYIVSV